MEMFIWIYELVQDAFRMHITYDPSFNINYDPDIPKAITLACILGTGVLGAILMYLIFRPLRLGFLGNVLFGLLGGSVGAYLFLSTVYNISPNETSLFYFDESRNADFLIKLCANINAEFLAGQCANININFLVGLCIGGVLGGFLITFLLGLLKNMVFSNRAPA